MLTSVWGLSEVKHSVLFTLTPACLSNVSSISTLALLLQATPCAPAAQNYTPSHVFAAIIPAASKAFPVHRVLSYTSQPMKPVTHAGRYHLFLEHIVNPFITLVYPAL